MCYGDPDQLLAQLLHAAPPATGSNGHTAEDDFAHFCAYSGLSEDIAGHSAFAWARCAYISAWRPRGTP
ncbi:hypothetical protein [Paraburkholderia sp. BL10I2N1]|uniref:hypothetical protein n=1 Tax=Paraburkholderia sp. BL10I2N1 TaxID=1938796 RepID=UPI00105D7AEA|nr:hypothetical protein [Paraburkholderia sp. BL10I2N1]TDN58991.1 hypothetical protein B0G77_8175 [Paraburkholderia sp. BL10I2N1]